MVLNNGIVAGTQLFPEPSMLAPLKAPLRFPGANSETTKALLEVLEDNHERFHIFFDDVGRHNHIPHHVIALWAMGAHQDLIRRAYKISIPLQRPMPRIPEPITPSNFIEHLGDETYWAAYLAFFDDVVKRHKGNPGTLMEEFIFSTKFNFGSTDKQGQHPQMLTRYLASILHPIIHFGYGVEFGLPGIMSEGLAETAVHPAAGVIIPESLFTSVMSTPNELTLNESPVHALTVVARILADPQFKLSGANSFEIHSKINTEALAKYTSQWTVDVQKLASDPKEIDRKIEEVQWMVTILYAIPGYKKDHEYNADFLNMHLVTSALFLPTQAAHLSPTSQALLLRAYFLVSVSWWIATGRPALDIATFISAEDASLNNQSHPTSTGPHPPSHRRALSSDPFIATNANPWLYLIQQASVHPDSHLPKLIRALLHFALLYGARKAGEKDFAQTELPGAEKLDGTLFVRAAALTAKRLESIEPVTALAYWDFKGFLEGSEAGTNFM